MTCDLCEEYQRKSRWAREIGDGGGGVTYYRVGTANIMIVGCTEHLTTVIKTLNKYYQEHGELFYENRRFKNET